VAVRYPGQVGHLAAIDVASGRLENLGEVPGASGFYVTALAFDAASRTLFYTTNNADWRHLVALDLATGRSRVLLRNARIGDLAFNPADRSLWGVRHDNGFSTLVRIPHPYSEWNQVQTLPYGRDLFNLDVSPDGATLIASKAEISGRQRLVRMDIAALLAGDTTHYVLYEFGDWSPSNFVFSPDGRYLFGSSYYSGVSNIFRYDFQRGVMEPLSNAETGFFKPVPISADSVLVFQYTGRGFVPSLIANRVPERVSAIRFLGNEIAERRPEVQAWMPPPVSGVNPDSLTTATGTYRSLRHLKLDSAYPVVEGYEDASGNAAVAGGVRLNFSDRIGTTALDVTSSWSPGQDLSSDERLHLRAVFRHWNWRIAAALNRADFYDLFGPTKTSRKGYSLAVQYQGSLFYDAPRSLTATLQVAGYGGLETVPEYQGVTASFDRLLSFNAGLAYGSLRRSLGAIEDELGATWDVTVRGNYVNGTLFPRLNLTASRGFLLPLDHSSLWFRASAGTALAGNRSEPFARFFFGGFGNNWVDHRAIRQFRDTESFPGIAINDVGGHNYGRVQVEWTSPPLRFRRAGIPSAYLRWAALSLFATGLVTDGDDAAIRRTFASVGAQLDVRLVTLSHLDSTFSIGFATARERGGGLRRSAWMFSFKIM
jgi:Tol biopolymer transport system component